MSSFILKEKFDWGNIFMDKYLYDKILDDKINKLRALISDDEEFDLTIDLIKQRIRKEFKWKVIYSEKDVFESSNRHLTEEILKRIQLNKL